MSDHHSAHLEVGGAHGTGQTLADRIARAALGAPHVAALHGGRWGTAGTYLPGRRIEGVQVDEHRVIVHLVAVFGITVAEVAASVRQALAGLTGDRRLDVVIEDLVPTPSTSTTSITPPLTAGDTGTGVVCGVDAGHVDVGRVQEGAPCLSP